MPFMEPDIVFGQWYEIETTHGTEFVPADVVGQLPIELGDSIDDDSEHWADVRESLREYCWGSPQQVTLIEGWGARLSAPGYMDCTDWTVFDTEQEAQDYLTETYGEEE